MSLEFGITTKPVEITATGYSSEGIQRARQMLHQDMPEAVEIDEALSKISALPGDGITKTFLREGIILLGANRGINISYPEGILYAEGNEKDEFGCFSVVRMGIWVVGQGRKFEHISAFMTEPSRIHIKDQLYSEGIVEVGDQNFTGAPQLLVGRTTLISQLDSISETNDVSYRFGQRMDLAQIDALDVPAELKAKLKTTVAEYHEDELALT